MIEPRTTTYPAADGAQLGVRIWDQSAPGARVVFLHGICSHSGWYLSSSAHLAASGLEVHFLERRGAGINQADRGDVRNWQVWLDDVETYLEQLGSGRPVVLCGISWGGKLAAAVARSRPDCLAGVALICPGLFAWQQPGLLKRLVLRCARPRWLAERQVPIPLADPALFTESPAWQAYIRDDPQTLRKVTLRFAREDLALTSYARQAPPFIHTPTLLLLAGRDLILQNVPTRNYFDELATSEKQRIEYPGAAHTLEFEDDPSDYFRDLTTWVQSITGVPRQSHI